MSRLAAALLLVPVLACAGSANVRPLGSFLVHDTSLDRVWSATLTALRQRAWPPTEAHHDADRGTIVTDWFRAGRQGGRYMDCGDSDRRIRGRGSLEIEVIREEDHVAVDIRARWRVWRRTTDEWEDCFTRGVAEDELRDAILSLIQESRGSAHE